MCTWSAVVLPIFTMASVMACVSSRFCCWVRPAYHWIVMLGMAGVLREPEYAEPITTPRAARPRARVAHGRRELAAETHDALVEQQRAEAGGAEPRDGPGVEPGEGAAIGLALGEDRRPGESRLRALEHEELEEPAVVVHGDAPLAVVIADHRRRARGPRAAAGRQSRAHAAHASEAQPPRNAAPPNGVTAPSQRCPVPAST